MLMKVLGLISRFIVSFTFLVISLSLLVLFFWADFLSEDLRNQAAVNITNYLQAPWYIHFPPVLLALLVWFLATWSLRSEFSRPTIIAFSTDSGPVQVSLKAVREHAIQVCESISGVKKVQDVHIQARSEGIDSIRLNLVLLKGYSVPTVTNQCTEKVKEEMRRTLGIERVNQVVPYIEQVEGAFPGSTEKEPARTSAFGGGNSPSPEQFGSEKSGSEASTLASEDDFEK